MVLVSLLARFPVYASAVLTYNQQETTQIPKYEGNEFLRLHNKYASRVEWEKINTQFLAFESGGSPVPVGVKSSNSGSRRGSSPSTSGMLSPVSSKKMTGIGSPQYRCLAKSQSLSL